MATIKDLITPCTLTTTNVDSWNTWDVNSSIQDVLDPNNWGNITIGPLVPNAYTYTTTGTGASSPWVTTDTIDGYNTLSVKGNADFDSDITVKGRSLTEFMESVEQRLNILRPNTELEKEWDQLRELGEQYRELEKQLTEKSQMWATLKK
jgi:hypothetical protein